MVSVAIGLCFREGRWLVGRRAEDVHLGGLWEFPGGKMGVGESPEEAAVREIAEEVGVQVRPVRALEVIQFSYPDREVELHPVLCEWVSGEPKPRDRAVVEARWVSYAELRELEMPAVNPQIIAQLDGL